MSQCRCLERTIGRGLKENSVDVTGIHQQSSHEPLRVEIHTARITVDQ